MLFQDLPGVSVCRFKEREYLMRRGDPMPYVYYLKKGEVKRETLTSQGTAMINTTKVGGKITASIVGLLEIYDSKFCGYSHDDFIATADCICYRIPVETCLQFMGEHPELLAEALTMTLDGFDELETRLAQKQDWQAPQAVANFLLRQGCRSELGLVVPKKFNNVEIAKYIGIHSVTISRIISVLCREGVAERIKEGLLLCDEEALQEYLTGERKMKYD